MAGLMSAGRQLASKGRMGDSILAHINPREAALLMAHGGMGTRNPKTGLMEFFTAEELNKLLNESLFGGSPEMGIDYGGDYSIPADTTDTTDAYKTSASATNVTDPDLKYTWQSDQDWAVPGRQKDTSYNVNVGSGDSVATDDPYETQRDESGKPTTSNYKYYQQGDDVYGPNVTKVYEDPTKWYSDMDEDTLSGLSLYYTDDGKYYYEDKDGNKYDITFDEGATSGTVTIGDKTYNLHKGNEKTFSYKIPTTEELQASDYAGKYDTTLTASEDWAKSAWEDIGYGWKKKTYGGETYFAMPGDDTTAAGYKGLTWDQVNNSYTYKGVNYNNSEKAWGAYVADDGVTDYYKPQYYGGVAGSGTGSPESGEIPADVLQMQRKLRPGEENDSYWFVDTVGPAMETVFNAAPYALAAGLTMGAFAPAAASALGLGEGAAGAVGGGVADAAAGAALPTFSEGLMSVLPSAGNFISSIPSTISTAVSGIGDLSLSSLLPSSMSKILVPAAIGGGVRGLQTDWDLAEMLKGAGIGALTGYGADRLKALWDYATTPNTSGPGSFSEGSPSFEGVESWTSEHPSELLANQGLDTKFGVPVTDNVAYDPTLVNDRPIYAGSDGKFYLDNWDFPDVTEEWITQNTPFYSHNGEWYMDNFDFPEYSVEDPFGKNWNIDWDQYNGGPVGLESDGILGSISKYLPSAATLGTVGGPGGGPGGGLDLSDLTGGGLLDMFTTNPYAKRNKYKRAIQLAAQKSGMTVQEYLAVNPKLQTYYYGLA